MKSLQDAFNDLIKAGQGEGSRGGKIVGHTKLGKPIYQTASTGDDWHSKTMDKMKNHSEAELRYIHKDASEASEAAASMGKDKESGRYADEAHYAAMEIRERSKTPMDSFRHHVTQHDMKNSNKPDYNKHALGQYAGAMQEADKKITNKKDPHETIAALKQHFEDNFPPLKKLIKEHSALKPKSVDNALNDLIKSSGEGSRGGKIVGHDKSGKPIYEGAKIAQPKPKKESGLKNWLHSVSEAVNEALGPEESVEEKYPSLVWNPRKSLDQALDDLIKAATGEGSRGGKIIGHTRSGKPIYMNAGNRAHKDFTKEDHQDAHDKHYHLQQEALDKLHPLKYSLQEIPGRERKKAKLQKEVDAHHTARHQHRAKVEDQPKEPDQRDFDHRDRLNDIDDGDRKSRGWDTSDGKKHAKALDTGKETYTSSDGIKRRTRDNTSDGWQG